MLMICKLYMRMHNFANLQLNVTHAQLNVNIALNAGETKPPSYYFEGKLLGQMQATLVTSISDTCNSIPPLISKQNWLLSVFLYIVIVFQQWISQKYG